MGKCLSQPQKWVKTKLTFGKSPVLELEKPHFPMDGPFFRPLLWCSNFLQILGARLVECVSVNQICLVCHQHDLSSNVKAEMMVETKEKKNVHTDWIYFPVKHESIHKWLRIMCKRLQPETVQILSNGE
jgi:hypothetical protein